MQCADVLLVEDDQSLMEVTRDFLQDNGLTVVTSSTGSGALQSIKECDVRLVVLDVNLPDLIGFDVCSMMRKKSNAPILFLSARISEMDKITGLEAGADDYISKPYSLQELLTRIRAQLRRAYSYGVIPEPGEAGSQGPESKGGKYRFGHVLVDFAARKVWVDDMERDFPAREFDLLSYFIQNRNKSIPKETIYNDVWGYDSLGEISTLSVHVRRLREKIEKDPSNPQFLRTVWSVGFRFEG